MVELYWHGTGAVGPILSSGKLLGSNPAKNLNDKSEVRGLKGKQESKEPEDTTLPKKLFFGRMQFNNDGLDIPGRGVLCNYTMKGGSSNIRGFLIFGPKLKMHKSASETNNALIIKASEVPLADLDLQIVVFVQEDLPAVAPGKDPLTQLLSDKGFFASKASDAKDKLSYYPAEMAASTITDSFTFEEALGKIIASARMYGFCFA